MKVEFEGETHEFPDDMTPEEISAALEAARPVVTPEEQEERDVKASQVRFEEVGKNLGKVEQKAREIKQILKRRPGIQGDARKILQRELSFWERLLEN